MRNLNVSLIVLLTISSFGYAGGDITPVVSNYEFEDEMVSEKAYVDEYIDEPVIEEEVYVAPQEEEIVEVTPPPPPPVVEVAKPLPTPTPTPPPATAVETKPNHVTANGFYAGLGITGVKYQSNCCCKKLNVDETTYGGVARLGYDFNQYVGIEARGSKTSGDGDVEHVGLYLKPMYPVSDGTNLYGLVGVAKTKITGDVPEVDSETLALGAGIEVDLSHDTPKEGRYSRPFDGQGDQEKGLGLFIDYERMMAKKDYPDADAVSAGVTYDF